MRIGKASVISVLVIAAMGIGTGIVHANPASPSVNYQTTVGSDGRSVHTTLENGTFRIASAGNAVDIVNASGTTLVSLPMAYSVRGSAFPISAAIDDGGRALTLTPDAASPIQDIDARGDAYQNMIVQWQRGWSNDGGVSAGIGTAIGAVVGCLLALIAACIPGAVLGGAIGAAVGASSANPALAPAAFAFIATF